MNGDKNFESRHAIGDKVWVTIQADKIIRTSFAGSVSAVSFNDEGQVNYDVDLGAVTLKGVRSLLVEPNLDA